MTQQKLNEDDLKLNTENTFKQTCSQMKCDSRQQTVNNYVQMHTYKHLPFTDYYEAQLNTNRVIIYQQEKL